VRATWTHDRPVRRWTTTTRPARAGRPYPANVNAALVSAEDGADSDTLALTAAACADDTAPSGDTIASTAANTTHNRQRDGRPARTPNMPTANLFTCPKTCHSMSKPAAPAGGRAAMMAPHPSPHTPFARTRVSDHWPLPA